MIVTHGDAQRLNHASTVFKDGDFAFRLEPEWAKWPEHLQGISVVGGCYDADDNLYLTTRHKKDHPVVMLDANGTYVKSIGAGLFSNFLHGIDYTSRGTLLCADCDLHVVREIDTDGNLIRDFGTLNQPSDSGFNPDIYEQLKKSGAIGPDQPYDKLVEFYEGLKTIRRAAPPFNKPTQMVEAPSGFMYASDGYCNAAVHKFAPDGTLVKTWGGPGDKPGQFCFPHGVWVDCRNRVWIADRENNRVQAFTEEGDLIGIVDNLLYRPAELWSNSDYIFIGEMDGGLTVLDMDMNILAQIGFWYSTLTMHGLCGDSKGNLCFQSLWLHQGDNIKMKGNEVMRLVRI